MPWAPVAHVFLFEAADLFTDGGFDLAFVLVGNSRLGRAVACLADRASSALHRPNDE